ncbi:universal stress protein [Kitasatospora sp. SUK 42]|uniref:universal stress protein n=1 Tax=Kitasatospora sp. SUK 42 TaxID=1588882 RepID=UPI0018CAB011|nr:universal stress protein [Kitasatospora sp. SUK 42]MBV2155329.1 universal stress protein [Kitasatospora sp. SUK 42]
MNTHVLTGVDGSEESTAAARWAADEAVRQGLGLRVVHAQTWLDGLHADRGRSEEFRTLTARMVADAARDVRAAHPDLDVRTDLLDGDDPVAALMAAAEDADMLVVGSLGVGGFEGLLVGSVGLAAAARCEVPLVLVRAGEQERVTGPDTPEVVVGVDTGAPADQVLDFAFRQAASRRAVLRAVHGWTPPPVMAYPGWVGPGIETEPFRAVEAGLLTQALAPWREKYPAVTVVEDCRVAGGAGAVVDASGAADLVVVGRRRRSHRLGMRLGPVAHAAIHHSTAPVAVVPHD